MDPTSYEEHLSKSSSVVHTIGTLFPDAGYKAALQSGNIPALLRILFSANNQNPLKGGSQRPSLYDTLNHDSALTVLATFLSNATSTASGSGKDRTFVYISAEDVFRPFVPSQYIESKRKCEREIRRMCESADSPVRSIFIRPGTLPVTLCATSLN
ncbi:hypothetical protein SISNIDRAFT_480773 [Sistotremastrum niveocremeum HHB9708]|uniref:Thioester reductase (TE) domain-containing protein n=1 Tax=Sistotremastrum niveocremeum HHB9708 TaxID=1314777 RepID=A0A165ALA5_9AGAM|nr:hypothetical protein SISNIDRAFT_480773 [Sistotremastrum niveocremeum HHB9708]